MYRAKYLNLKTRPRKQAFLNPDDPLSINILKVVGLGLIVATASFLSPQFLAKLVYSYIKYKLKYRVTEKQVYKSVKYLERKKFIAFPASGEGKVKLTKLGQQRLSAAAFQSIKIQRTTWDNIWRFITFDIPEARRAQRHLFRQKLKELGFFHFQRSVFLLPFPCEKEIEEICEYLEISECVHLIHAKRFPTDQSLIKKFSLQK